MSRFLRPVGYAASREVLEKGGVLILISGTVLEMYIFLCVDV